MKVKRLEEREEKEEKKKNKRGKRQDLLHRRTLVTGPIFSCSLTRGGILPPAGDEGTGAGKD